MSGTRHRRRRTLYRVPVAFTCALLGLSASWFYTWRARQPTRTRRRRARLDTAAAAARGLHRSPRLYLDLREAGWVGDITGIPTAARKLYPATVIDPYSRRLLGGDLKAP